MTANLDVKGSPISEDPSEYGPVDHDYTDEIVCPYCGHEHGDSWEYGDSGRMTCGECNREFDMERNVSVSYVTSRIDRDAESRAAAEKLRRMAAIRAACDTFTPGMRVRIVCEKSRTGWIYKGKLATVVQRHREPLPDEHTYVDLHVDGVDYRHGCTDFSRPEDLEPWVSPDPVTDEPTKETPL